MHTTLCRHLPAALLLACFLSASASAQLLVENNQKLFAPYPGSFGAAVAIGDMDGDGWPDLVIGNPAWEDLTGGFSDPNAGQIAVVYNEQGQFAQDLFFWDVYYQATYQPPNFKGQTDDDDLFGHAIVVGDFNADGRDDVVVSAPGDHFPINGIPQRVSLGSVTVAYPIDSPTNDFNQTIFRQGDPDIDSNFTLVVPGNAEDGERFGWAMAVGDFNGDTYDDLAVGVPGESLEGTAIATGAVNVVFSNPPGGLKAEGAQFLHQATSWIVGAAEPGDEFGDALVAGNFNCDDYDDLVVGIHQEDIGDVTHSGAAVVLYGGPSGLGDEILPSASFHQGRTDVIGNAEAGDRLGSSLASGDFNGDGCDDLAVGIPFEDVDPFGSAGGVAVFYGSLSDGLTAANDQFIDGSWAEQVESGDQFGSSLASGDFNNDGKDDLVVGVLGEEFDGGPANAGAVNIIYGSDTGLVAAGSEVWHAATPGIVGDPMQDGEFGAALATGRLNAGGKDDLVIGAPYTFWEQGSVHILLADGPLLRDRFEEH